MLYVIYNHKLEIGHEKMSTLRNLTKVPKLCLLYFNVDKSTCVVETKKIRSKESGEPFSVNGPERKALVSVKTGGKHLDAMVIATNGKYIDGYLFV